MPWLRDWQSLRGPRLRTLVVLGLVFAVVAETPLRAVGGLPAWLTLGGTSTVAGSAPPQGAPGASQLLAASKHRGDKHGKHKGGKKGKRAKDPDVSAEARKKAPPDAHPDPIAYSHPDSDADPDPDPAQWGECHPAGGGGYCLMLLQRGRGHRQAARQPDRVGGHPGR